MNDLIASITSPGARKYLYRVTWAILLMLVASGRLDESQLNAVLGVVAAVLAVADSQTTPDTPVAPVASTPRMEAHIQAELPAAQPDEWLPSEGEWRA